MQSSYIIYQQSLNIQIKPLIMTGFYKLCPLPYSLHIGAMARKAIQYYSMATHQIQINIQNRLSMTDIKQSK